MPANETTTASDAARARPGSSFRIRVRYAKNGKVRFVSAIDLGRIWERALRRADLPIAYSEGFSPHPKVSFTDALPLGYASSGEYAELTLWHAVDLEAAMDALNSAFPAGVHVLDAVAVGDGAPRLAKWLGAACWDIEYPSGHETRLASAVAAALEATALPVERERKGEVVTTDLRPAIHDLRTSAGIVRAILHHGEPAVRPTEVHLALLSQLKDLDPPQLPQPTLVTRVAQGTPGDDGLVEALRGTAVRADPRPTS